MKSLLQDYVTEQATRRPDALAVVSPEAILTYGELERRSNQVASILRNRGCVRGDRVALLMPKSASAIAAIIGIYKADCIYVPLDPSSPAPRLRKMLDAAGPAWILTAGVQTLIEELMDEELRKRTRIGRLDASPDASTADFDLAAVETSPSAPVASENRAHDPAHLLFTSGSTGTPKGVVITHANVIAFVEWAVQYFGIGENDRLSGHPPLHFDLSMFDIFGTFAAGATLFLVPPELTMFPNKAAEFIRRHELTQWFSVPSLLTYMANMDAVRQNDFPALKRLLWCGEVLATPSLMYWMRRLPHVTFTNLYGPTEATIASSYYTVPQCPASETETIPIGFPCDGERLYVLDSNLRPLPPGEVGDLFIAGAGLSPGYWRNPEATASAFLADPFSNGRGERMYRTGDLAVTGPAGEVYFRGRADSQVKCRGHRVELGEIEAILGTSTTIDECAVVSVPSAHFAGHTICCAYVAGGGKHATPAILRSELATKLPTYMIPTEWMQLPALPKNANGKTDRPLLKRQFENRGERNAEM